jgi:hypothetical protein
MDVDKFRWFIARLLAMPFPELPHRLLELFRKKVLELFPTSHKLLPSNVGKHYKREPSWVEDFEVIGIKAQDTLSNGPKIFGRYWPHRDSGQVVWDRGLDSADFSKTKSFRIKYRDTDNWESDIRQLWELNRLVWLLPIARYVADVDDQETRDYLRDTVGSFLDSDRVGYSVRWNSAIEIAMQALSLLSIEKILGEKGGEILPTSYFRALSNRLRWLEFLPSKHSSENNHRVAEVVAMICLYERLGHTSKRIQKRLRELSDLVQKQFGEDGFNKEQSFDYHLFTLDLLSTGKILSANLALSQKAEEKLKAAQTATRDIFEFCGFWPSANDSDEAKLLGSLEEKNLPPFRLYERAFGPIGRKPEIKSHLHLKEAGFFFTKSIVKDVELVLLVDHGEIGLAPLFAHAHADIQAFWLWANQVPILIESGTFSYHASPSMRQNLQSSTSHNSISINGWSTIEPAGPFVWHERDLPRETEFSHTKQGDLVSISLACLLPLRDLNLGPCLWKRKIELQGLVIRISDQLGGSKDFRLAEHFVFSSALKPEPTNLSQLRLTESDILVDVSSEGRMFLSSTYVAPFYSHLENALALKIVPRDSDVKKLETVIEIRRKA